MNKDLLPIIAAYWGCMCSYEDQEFIVFDWVELKDLQAGKLKDFKVHLRKLINITAAELIEVAKIMDIESSHIALNTYPEIETEEEAEEELRIEITDELLNPNNPDLIIYSDSSFVINSPFSVNVINFLRSKGFCLDEELVDANLVVFVEYFYQHPTNQSQL